MADVGNLLARLMLTVLFFVSAWGKIANVAGVAKVLAVRGVPLPVATGYLFALLELAGALMVVTGYRVRLGAVLLLLLTAGTILVSHNFWDMDGLDSVRNQTQALKNLAIMGGLLMVAVAGAGRFAWRPKGWPKRK
jgi:putative oxidoreductase